MTAERADDVQAGGGSYEPPAVEEKTPIGKPLIGASKTVNVRVIARARAR